MVEFQYQSIAKPTYASQNSNSIGKIAFTNSFEGNQSRIPSPPANNGWSTQNDDGDPKNGGKDVYNYTSRKTTEKTPMCRIAELARYHKLKHEYVLLDESGPAHKKQFRVKLVLRSGEEYEGSGASIKKAQQSAAENALGKTSLPRPPRKPHGKPKTESNPVFLLQNVANQLNISIHFEDRTEYSQPTPLGPFVPPNHFPTADMGIPMPPPMGIPRPPLMLPMPNRQNSPTPNVPFFMRMPPPPMPPDGPAEFCGQNYPRFIPTWNHTGGQFMNMMPKIRPQPSIYQCAYILSDGTEHYGQGRTLNNAKVDAALHSLFHLRPLLNEVEAKLMQSQSEFSTVLSNNNDESSPKSSDSSGSNSEDEGAEIDCTKEDGSLPQIRSKTKSVVSQIHECAFRLRMIVEFEVLMESGEPHNRRYTLRCRLSSPRSTEPIIADGEGSSKKVAKQKACQLMLEKIKGFENDPVYLASVIVKQTTKKPPTTNKEAKRKTIIKDMKMDPLYGHHINPISRLIQVMQIRKEPEPVFRLIGEHGQNRYREFVVEVTCMDLTQRGMGPNKKLAKRAAAVAMLDQIGYVKPMPQPGKSLLKKRSSGSSVPVDPMFLDSLQIPQSVEIGVFDSNEMNTPSPNGEVAETKQSFSNSSSPLQSFADVDAVIAAVETCDVESSSPIQPVMRGRSESEKPQPEELTPIRSQKRRVTFSNQVSACPPPDDSSYPEASIAPLKSEVVLFSKPKRRGRDSKKALTAEEKTQIVAICRLFSSLPNANVSHNGLMMKVDENSPPISDNFAQLPEFGPNDVGYSFTDHDQYEIRDAKYCLERLAKHYKFTVSYSDFQTMVSSQNEYFSLVSLGLDKTVVCHGCGPTEENSHNDAAFSAIQHLSALNNPIPNAAANLQSNISP